MKPMEEGSVKCKMCDGKGTVMITLCSDDPIVRCKVYEYIECYCSSCSGKGVVDWISNITKVKNPLFGRFYRKVPVFNGDWNSYDFDEIHKIEKVKIDLHTYRNILGV